MLFSSGGSSQDGAKSNLTQDASEAFARKIARAGFHALSEIVISCVRLTVREATSCAGLQSEFAFRKIIASREASGSVQIASLSWRSQTDGVGRVWEVP